MKQSKLNLLIDAIMLILMVSIIGIGLLVKYILLTGKEKWDSFGGNFDFTLLGLDRHEWGQLHFILGLILIGLLLLHLILHWKMIVGIFKKTFTNKKIRIVLAFSLLIISIGLIVFPFLIKPKIGEPLFNYRNFQTNSQDIPLQTKTENVQKAEEQHSYLHNNQREKSAGITINGSMTLIEISKKYKIPLSQLKKSLNISSITSDNERLGRLRRAKGFTMSDVEEIIYNYKKKNKHDTKN